VLIVGNDADFNAALLLQLQVRNVVAGIFGGRGQHHIARLQRQ
jgi:hypothetical protein